jgi:hypothetical protein
VDEQVLLTHPHDFFRFKNLGVNPSTCFVLMPFAHQFDLVYETIEKALKGLMVCTRADDIAGPVGGPILERVLRGIATAELVVADLTGRNANVFYELGIAHTQTKNVLLLTQTLEDVPFDLRALHCNLYQMTSTDGLTGLRNAVRRAAHEVSAKRVPSTLEGNITRTQLILDHMRGYLADRHRTRLPLIRIQAGISSLGNLSPAEGAVDDRHATLLNQERELLLQLAEAGALIQAILSPHRVSLGPNDLADHWGRRIDRVIEFLRCTDAAAAMRGEEYDRRCQVVLCPVPGPNLLFFDDRVLFEGHKTSVERGFGWTMLFTDRQLVKVRIGIFDRLFESARAHTLEQYGCNGDLRAAAVRGLELAKHTAGTNESAPI